MSMRKYKNPVNNYFIYNDDIRKSTCRICYFDMAGRHSENLMRHLKRKHPQTYTQVMIEKQQRRTTAAADSAARRSHKQSGSSDNTAKATDTAAAAEVAAAATGPSSLSSMFRFETEPHKLFIKSEKLVFRLDDPGQHQQQQQQQQQLSPHTDDFDNNNDNDNNENQAAHAQFESVYFSKAQLCDELDHSSASAPAECQLTYPDEHLQDEFIITSLPHQASTSPSSAADATGSDVPSASTRAIPCTEDGVTELETAIATPFSCTNDDAYFLQYLGNKFGKYSSTTKSTVQFQINRILYKADIGLYEHVDASKLSDTDL